MRKCSTPSRGVTSIAMFCAALILGGCAMDSNRGDTLGERASGYGYVPLDPLPVQYKAPSGAPSSNGTTPSPNGTTPSASRIRVLDSLPDLTVRFAVADIQAGGGLDFGVVKSTVKYQDYRAILDYVNVDVVPVPLMISKVIKPIPATGENAGHITKMVRLTDRAADSQSTVIGYKVSRVSPNASPDIDPTRTTLVTIPVYVGVGLRLTADIRALKSDINLTSLSAIGVQAESEALTGTLTVQTLGIYGSPIATTIPLPNKLDQTTIENAILAIGGIRATIYTANTGNGSGAVGAQPRIVGLYSPVGTDPLLINAIYAELSNSPPEWPAHAGG